MFKKGRLSKEEKKYIADNASDGAESISENLNRSVAVVEKELLSIEEPETKGQTGELMARNEKYGAVVMTENASMASDESKSKKDEPELPRRYRGSIHKIKD